MTAYGNPGQHPYQRYRKALVAFPRAGTGVHSHIMRCACFGAAACLPADEVEADINKYMTRPPSPSSEVSAAVRKAYSQSKDGSDSRKTKPLDLTATRNNIAAPYMNHPDLENEIRNASPIQIPDNPGVHETRLLLETLYTPEEFIFVGAKYSILVRPVRSILDQLQKDGPPQWPHFIPNPLTGNLHPDSSGELSYRCDNAVCKFRFALCEFDKIPQKEQLAFFAGARLPIAALVDSGKKSIHALLKVDAPDRDSWERDVENDLFRELLIPMGCDGSCRNESRLSRLPGHFRTETERWQRLLYLNPTPKMGGIFS